MNDSDRRYLSRFALDPAIEFSCEDIDGFDFSYEDEMDPRDDKSMLDTKNAILEDGFPFED